MFGRIIKTRLMQYFNAPPFKGLSFFGGSMAYHAI